MQAVILAGGFGTRLQAAISDVPKPMAPINGKPFLQILLDDLADQGFTNVVLSVYHLKEKIIDYFGSQYKSLAISYAAEPEPLGTGGAIKFASEQLDEKDFFVINGDTFVELCYADMLMQKQKCHADFVMAVHHKQDCSRYGEVVMDEHQQIITFAHQQKSRPGFINAGIYLMNKDLLNKFDLAKTFSFEQDFLYPHINQIAAFAFLTDNYFIDIGIPEDYQKMNEDFKS